VSLRNTLFGFFLLVVEPGPANISDSCAARTRAAAHNEKAFFVSIGNLGLIATIGLPLPTIG
jgi:hypothetical protein